MILCGLLLSGCSKQEATQRPGRATIEDDVKSVFIEVLGAQMQLLAVKYQIPPQKAEAVAWGYYRVHDRTFGLMEEEKAPLPGSKDPKIGSVPSEGVRKTITDLAARHELKEETVAAFLADLRVFQQSGRGL